MRRIKGHTDLPWPFKLDDLMPILINMDLFLRVMAPVLDEDEQQGTDEPGERVPFHGCVTPCGRQTFGRKEHSG